MTDALAPVALTASKTELNTGTPSILEAALPGVTPPTIFVPYSSICFVWNVPTAPVIPWTRTLVLLSTNMLMDAPPSVRPAGGGQDDFLRRVAHVGRGNDVELCRRENLLPLFHVRPLEPDDQGNREAQVLRRRHHAFGDDVAPHDPAEDVHEDRLHLRVGKDEAEGVGHLLDARAASHVEEVRRVPAAALDHVHRGHRQPRAVHHAADVAVEADVGEVVVRRLRLRRVLLVEVPQR